VCGCRDLGEALRRIHEGAAMIRTKGEAGTGNVVEAVRHMRALMSQIRALRGSTTRAVSRRRPRAARAGRARRLGRREHQKLPVPNFSAGGVATPADAALMMQLGAEAVFVGSGIFKSGDPRAARARDRARRHALRRPEVLAEVSKGLGEPMVGIDVNTMAPNERARRPWHLSHWSAFSRCRATSPITRRRCRPKVCARCQVRKRERSRRDSTGNRLPGGESTTMLKLLDVEGLWEPLGKMPCVRACPCSRPAPG
jgi:hypothetical protein